MMARGWRVGRILGIELRIDGSWLFVAVLVAYSFYLQFVTAFERLADGPAVALAIGAALLFFGSVLTHEMAHALVARRRGIEVRGITLFLFGGATHARVESRGPRDEFVVSAVGPLTSLGLAGLLAGAGLLARPVLPEAAAGALVFLGWLNLVLAVFNLLPGFPLDGGRLLRSFLWSRSGDLMRATRTAGVAGQTVGYLLVAGGVALAALRQVGGGIWLAAIGWFLAQAARASVEDQRTRQLLEQATNDNVLASPGAGAAAPSPDGQPARSDHSPPGEARYSRPSSQNERKSQPPQ